VLASGFAYEYEGLMPRGLLKGKSAWGIYTIVSPKWYVKVWRRRAEWEAIGRATLQFCGLHPVKRFMFAGVRNSTERQRDKWLRHIQQKVKEMA